jgi:hypothetical protein
MPWEDGHPRHSKGSQTKRFTSKTLRLVQVLDLAASYLELAGLIVAWGCQCSQRTRDRAVPLDVSAAPKSGDGSVSHCDLGAKGQGG